MIETRSELRIYGLMRNDGLDGIFPSEGPEGWDCYPVCKLALRGGLGAIDAPSVTRPQTPWQSYRDLVRRQETGTLATAFFFRRVVSLFLKDPEFRPLGRRGALALAHRTLRMARGAGAPEGESRLKSVLEFAFRGLERLIGEVAIKDRARR